VSTDVDDGRIVIISMVKASTNVSRPQSLQSTLELKLTGQADGDTSLYPEYRYNSAVVEVFVRTGSEEEGEALMAGLQVIVSDLKNKVKFAISFIIYKPIKWGLTFLLLSIHF